MPCPPKVESSSTLAISWKDQNVFRHEYKGPIGPKTDVRPETRRLQAQGDRWRVLSPRLQMLPPNIWLQFDPFGRKLTRGSEKKGLAHPRAWKPALGEDKQTEASLGPVSVRLGLGGHRVCTHRQVSAGFPLSHASHEVEPQGLRGQTPSAQRNHFHAV